MSNPGYCPDCGKSGWACRCGREPLPTIPALNEMCERLRTLLAEASKPNTFEWHFPWRVIPCDGKPIIAGAKSGNLFRGYIATWQEANLAVGAVNALPELLATIERLSAEKAELREALQLIADGWKFDDPVNRLQIVRGRARAALGKDAK